MLKYFLCSSIAPRATKWLKGSFFTEQGWSAAGTEQQCWNLVPKLVSSVCVWGGCHSSGYCTAPVPRAAVHCHSRALSMKDSTSCPGQLGCTSHRNIYMESNNLSWLLSSSCPDVGAHLCVHYLMNAVRDATLWWGAELRSLKVTWEVKNLRLATSQEPRGLCFSHSS